MKCESLLFKLCLVSDNNKPIIPALDVPIRVINKQWSPKKHMQYWFLSFPFPFGQGVQLNALPQLQWEYQMLSVLHVSRLKWSINSLTWCERDKENILKENLGGFFFCLSDWPGYWNIFETISHQKIKHLIWPDHLYLSCIHWKIWISAQSGNNTCCK